MAYGLESSEEYKKRKLREQANPLAPNPDTWNENDVRAIREYYSRPQVQAPLQEERMARIPESTGIWDTLKGAYGTAKDIALPWIGGASESVGKPIARLINQISGADTGLTQEQMDRKYGLQRLLGREPTAYDEFAYGVGSALPLVGAGVGASKLGLGLAGNIATGIGLGGAAGGIGAYGRGAGAEDIAKSTAEGMAFAPGLMAGSALAGRALGAGGGFLRGAASDIAGGIGGTLTSGLARKTMGGEMPEGQEYLQSILANLILGRGTAGAERLFKAGRVPQEPIAGRGTKQAETPQERASNIGDILNLNKDRYGRAKSVFEQQVPIERTGMGATEQQRQGIYDLFNRQVPQEPVMTPEQRAAQQAQQMAGMTGRPSMFEPKLTPEQMLARQSANVGGRGILGQTPTVGMMGERTTQRQLGNLQSELNKLNVPRETIVSQMPEINRQMMQQDIQARAMQQNIAGQQPEIANRQLLDLLLREQVQPQVNRLNVPRETINAQMPELNRQIMQQDIQARAEQQRQAMQQPEIANRQLLDLLQNEALRTQKTQDYLKSNLPTGEQQVSLADLLQPKPQEAPLEQPFTPMQTIEAGQQQTIDPILREQFGRKLATEKTAESWKALQQPQPSKIIDTQMKDIISNANNLDQNTKYVLLDNLELARQQNKNVDLKGLYDFIKNKGDRLTPEMADSIFEDFSKTPTKLSALNMFNELNTLPNIDPLALDKLYKTIDKVINLEDAGQGVHLDLVGIRDEMKASPNMITTKDIDSLVNKYIAIDQGSQIQSELSKMLSSQRGSVSIESLLDPFGLFKKEKGQEQVKKKDLSNLVDLSWMKAQEFIRPQPPVAKNGEFNIRSIAQKDPTSMNYEWAKFLQENLDSKWSLSRMSKIANDPYLKALSYNTNHTGVIADRIIEKNMVNMDGKVVGDSLRSVFDGLSKQQFDDFLQYQYNKHNLNRLERGLPIDTTITKEMSLENIAKLERENPKIVEASQKWSEFTKGLLKNLVLDEGIIDQATFDKIIYENPNYIPTPRAGYRGTPNTLNRATGSTTDRAILNGVEVMVDTVRKFVNVAARQRLYNRLYETTLKNPESMKPFMEILPSAEKPVKLQNIDQLDNYINKLLKVSDPNDLMQGRIKNLMVNGEMKRLKLNDDLLFDSLESLPERQQDQALTLMRKGTNFAKSLITTYNPLFGLANLTRDFITGYINTPTRINPIKYTQDFAGSMLDIILDRPIYQDYLNMGGGGMVARQGGLSPTESTAAKARSFIQSNDPISMLRESGKQALANINKFNESIESASRLAEYKRVLDVMGNTPEARQIAINAADEITVNFGKRGSAQRIKTLDTFYPYFNAALQGIANPFTQQSGGNLAPMLGKAAFSLVLPSVLSYLFLKDDPEYQKLDQRIKDDFLIIPYKVNGSFVKMPLSKEYATPLHAVPVRILEAVMKGKPESFTNELLTTIMRNYAPLDPIKGSILSPIGRTFFSKEGSDWLGRPLLNKEDVQVEPWLQYDENTSYMSKQIGKLFNWSPKKLDNLGMSYLGGIAQVGIPLSSEMGSTIDPRKPMESLVSLAKGGKNVLAKRFTADPLYNTEALNKHYAKFDKLQAEIKGKGRLNEADVPFEKKWQLKQLNKINTAIADIRRVKNKISAGKELTGKDLGVLIRNRANNITNMNREDKLREMQRLMVAKAETSNLFD